MEVHTKKSDETKTSNFSFKAPITKFWEEEMPITKANGEKSKSNERFIEVNVSGLKEDRDGERMSEKGINHMVDQFKSGTIPFFPDHGRDEITGQPHVYSWKQMMGVWVDARKEEGNLPAVVRLNQSHPDHEQFWGYVQAGMPLAFSIGGKPREPPEEVDDGEDEDEENGKNEKEEED